MDIKDLKLSKEGIRNLLHKVGVNNLFADIKWLFDKTKGFSHYIIGITIIGAMTSVLEIYRALASKWLVDSATSANINLLYKNLFILAGLIIANVIIGAISTAVVTRGSVGLSNSVQNKIYTVIMNTKWMDYLKYHSGDFLTRMTSDTNAVTNVVIDAVPSLISLIVLLIGSFIVVFRIDPILAITIITLLPLMFLFVKVFSSKLKKIYLESQSVESEYRSFVNESIQNMLVVKTFCLEKRNIKKVITIQEEKKSLILSRTKISVVASSVMTIASWAGFFIVFLWGSVKIANGTASFGTLMALIQLIGNIQGPLLGIAEMIPELVYSLASAERLKEIEDLERDVDGVFTSNFKSAGIKFEKVSFKYNKGVEVLKDISLNIRPGETVALIGSSGEGKTTLVHLILSLLSPQQGNVYIYDSQNNAEVNANSRGSISYVPQGNTTFSGTIADNLRLGKADATDEELEKAAKAACAWDFIEETEEGLNTKVGERGMGLSEGQAQRIAIARALLHEAPILLLDEATSALDSKTELSVLESIQSLDQSPTCIIITHRPSALEICDRILEVENGMIQEIGIKDIVKNYA